MARRALYLAAYDVSQPGRLAVARALVGGYATGGQKSVDEIFPTPLEKREFIHAMSLLLDEHKDRVLLLQLAPHERSLTQGRARPPADPSCFYFA